jgi:hypothetical protein
MLGINKINLKGSVRWKFFGEFYNPFSKDNAGWNAQAIFRVAKTINHVGPKRNPGICTTYYLVLPFYSCFLQKLEKRLSLCD